MRVISISYVERQPFPSPSWGGVRGGEREIFET